MMSNDVKPRRRVPLGRLFSWLTTAAIVGGGLFLVVAPTPYLVEQPGPVYNLLSEINGEPMISISEQKTYPVSGDLDMLTVTMRGNSTKGVGQYRPESSVITADGVIVPNGTLKDHGTRDSLYYNEYIVYDVAQIKIKYLLHVSYK